MDESELQKRPQPAATPADTGTAQAAEPAPAGRPGEAPGAAEPVRLGQTGENPGLRASDADRDRVADILREALAEGRLDAEEHSERLDRVYSAKTVGELEPLVRDLPAGAGAAPVAGPSRTARTHAGQPAGENPTLVGILSGAERKGRWRVGSRITAVAVMGGVEIDLTEATFTSPELVIQCTAIMGGVTIRVPENVTLRGSGVFAVMGGADVRACEAPDPQAPVVRVTGVAVCGGVEAKAKRGKRVADWAAKRFES